MSQVEAAFRGRVGEFALDAAFSVPAQGVTALFGPSGSGKTTLLRCLAGLQRLPGRLTVRGETWQDEHSFLPTHRRPIGYVFQEPSLLSHLPVKGNLAYGYRRRQGETRISLEEVVELLGLQPLLDRSCEGLSGGERQRVAIGRALLAQPQLLLMDEPLAGLHGQAKAEVLPYLERLHASLSMPVIYVSHDPAEIARVADHLLTMRQGRIVGSAPMRGSSADPLEAAARLAVAQMDPERLSRLALAALLRGLEPHGSSQPPK
jgi:molybdate transport system ATP-binding protein